jgi:hypothetical protein
VHDVARASHEAAGGVIDAINTPSWVRDYRWLRNEAQAIKNIVIKSLCPECSSYPRTGQCKVHEGYDAPKRIVEVSDYWRRPRSYPWLVRLVRGR